jgi:hypothetical protein
MTTLEINEEVESLKQISIAICNGIVQKKNRIRTRKEWQGNPESNSEKLGRVRKGE